MTNRRLHEAPHHHLARLGAVALIGAIALAGCGSDDSGDDSSSSDNSKTAAKGDGTLTIGTLLPSTGDLAYLGPPEFAGVDLAIKEINDAGGVNGKPIKQIKSDSGDGTPDIAGASVDKLHQRQARRRRRCGLLQRVAVGHRQDHRRRPGAVLAGEHRGRVRHLRRRRALLPHLAVRPPPGPGHRQPRRRGRLQERRRAGSPGRVRRGSRPAGRGHPEGEGCRRRLARPLQRRRGELHRRGQRGRREQAGRHRAGRLRGDHQDRPAAGLEGLSVRTRSSTTSWTATWPTTRRASSRST